MGKWVTEFRRSVPAGILSVHAAMFELPAAPARAGIVGTHFRVDAGNPHEADQPHRREGNDQREELTPAIAEKIVQHDPYLFGQGTYRECTLDLRDEDHGNVDRCRRDHQGNGCQKTPSPLLQGQRWP
jgi:hypothetical protein